MHLVLPNRPGRWIRALMVEPLVLQPNAKASGYMVDGDEKKIIPLVRQAAELGADIIKADPTDGVSLYHKGIESAGSVLVLVRGGGKVGDREILQRTHNLLAQGAAGIVYGRNIIQRAKPAAITNALMGIVHDGLSVDQASPSSKTNPSPPYSLYVHRPEIRLCP